MSGQLSPLLRPTAPVETSDAPAGALRIVMCGCAEIGRGMIRYLHAHGIHLAQIVALTPAQATRYSVSGYAAYDDLAEAYGIPLYTPATYALSDPADVAFFRAQRFDLLLVGGWQRLIPQEVLDTLTYGGLGIHGSSEFLPKGRGRSPINWSLIEGKQRFILHLFLMKSGADDGSIVAFDTFDINAWDDCNTLYYKNGIVSKRLVLDAIRQLTVRRTLPAVEQTGEATHYPKRTPADGQINWSKTVFEIYNFVRALTHPYPGAFTYADGQQVFIWRAQPFDTRITYYGHAEGEVVEVFDSGDFVVNCNSGLLLVRECSARVAVGTRFTNLPQP